MPIHAVHTPNTLSPKPQGQNLQFPPCFSCGKRNHKRQDCFLRDAVCNSCKKKGHIKAVFKAPNTNVKRKSFHKIEEAERKFEDFFCIQKSYHDKIWVSMTLDGKPTKMELDTGASLTLMTLRDYYSIFKKRPVLKPTDKVLRTYTGEIIEPLGYVDTEVKIQNTTKTLPLIILRKGSNPLFGRNWLHQFKLPWFEIKAMKTSIGGTTPEPSTECKQKLAQLLAKHKVVFSEGIGNIQNYQADLTVRDNVRPKFCKARPVPYALKAKVEKEINELEKNGIISKVNHSEWATPVVPILKKSGDVRLCGDFKVTINPVLIPEQYTLPRVEDIFANLEVGQKFSKIDLRQAYHQLPLTEDSKHLTTINTHKGLYQYNRLVFGITSAPAVWQKTMDKILQGAEGVQCNQDDMIVTGEDEDKHLQNLAYVLKCLEDNNIKANKDKCKFMQDEVIFCGFKLDSDGLHKTEDKVEAILKAPVPQDKTQLRSFLGLLHYYHKFLRNIAHITTQLHELTGKNTTFAWSKKCDEAFMKAKELIASDQVLIRYHPDFPLRLACDASPYGIGSVLSHVTPDGHEKPIAYASRTLTKAEKNYS
ncbi:uncharacterized protein K02A2.6-like [Argonauta hians]